MTIYLIIFTIITIFYIITLICLSKSKQENQLPSPIALQLVVNQMSDSYIVLDKNNNITDYNETFAKTFNVENFENMNLKAFLKEIKTSTSDIEKILEISKKVRKVASPDVQVALQPHESKKLNLVAPEKSCDFSYAIRKVASPDVQVALQPHESKKLNLVAPEKSCDFSYAIKKGNNSISFEQTFDELQKTFQIEVTPITLNEDILGVLFLFKDITQHIKYTTELEEHKKELTEKLEKTYVETIQTIQHTVEAKDLYTRGHSNRVSEYSVLIGEKLELSEDDISRLRIGGLFHDVGKIGIPDNILQKDGKLSDEEYSEIKKHPTIGAQILSNSSIFEEIIPIVKYHHERYDGKGYPEGLKGEDIPYLARITAIADAFDAMTSRRVYRDSLSLDVVIEEIEKNKGTQFDPEIADVFLDILKNEYEKIEKNTGKNIVKK